jgi:hypothetical protein
VARATGRTDELRIRKLKKTVSEKHTQMLVVLGGGLVLLREVVAICRWRHGPAGEALMRAATVLGDVAGMQTLPPLMQVFTHYNCISSRTAWPWRTVGDLRYLPAVAGTTWLTSNRQRCRRPSKKCWLSWQCDAVS